MVTGSSAHDPEARRAGLMQTGRGGLGMRSLARDYARTARELVVSPERFFREARGSSTRAATLFVFSTYLLVTLLSSLLILPLLLLTVPAALQEGSASGGELLVLVLILVASLLLAPFAGVLGTLVGALLWHPFVALSVGRGRGAGFRETYRVAAYQSLPYVLGNLIPLVGFFVAVGGMSYVGVLGLKGAHGASTARAVVAVLIPLVLTFLLFVALILLLFAYSGVFVDGA